jgi:hypothetical protein
MASEKDTSGQLNFVTAPFDAIRHLDGEREFWRARELSTAYNAGVVTSDEHAQFQNAGYSGLYGGLTEDDIHALKKLEPGDEISNWMESEELADTIFRAAQTDAAMKRNKVQDKEKANKTHFEVGNKVREFIIHELGGTPPEELPTPEKSIRQIEQEEQFRLKHEDQLNLFEPPSEETVRDRNV